MLLFVSFFSALAGLILAAAAALFPDTGINGTIGRVFASAGSAAAMIALGVLTVTSFPTQWRGAFGVIAALAAWFLQQNALLATMIVALLAVRVSLVMTEPTGGAQIQIAVTR